MQLQIRDHKRVGGAITLKGHNMKLGRGGIREIEFFTQTRQLIAGGRDTDLRVLGTQQGLTALAQKGWVEHATANVLTDHYRAHRLIEHRLQMINDAQTHSLPTSKEGFDRLAALMGSNSDNLQKDIMKRLSEVHELTEGFFAGPMTDAAPEKEDGFEETSIRELAEILRDISGWTGALEFDTRKPDGAPRKVMNNDRIHGLGWRHSTQLKTGLQQAYQWFLENQDIVRR